MYYSFGDTAIDKMADDFRQEGMNSSSFLFSDLVKENTEEQLSLMRKVYEEAK